jgi:hypothetical protein
VEGVYIRDYFPTASVYWHELYEPFSNFEFLDYINRGEAKQWCEQMATEQSMMHQGVYIVIKDNKSQFELIKNYHEYILLPLRISDSHLTGFDERVKI